MGILKRSGNYFLSHFCVQLFLTLTAILLIHWVTPQNKRKKKDISLVSTSIHPLQEPLHIDTSRFSFAVGDHSGSHSERYFIKVGDISHQSPGFGLMGSGTYSFAPGTYPISVHWVGSNIATPDYDYTAAITLVGGNGAFTVTDPQGKTACIMAF
jgi:hypothetical protein